jgi:putative Holliday junction resolvase
MALDVGDVRIGVATTDPLRIIASPHSVIQHTSTEKDVEAIAKLVSDLGVVRLVVGLPLNQHGQPGPQAEKVLQFVDALKAKVDVEIVTQDERFTTAASQRTLIQADMRRKDRKKVIDKVAAQNILQTYLDRQARLSRENP